MLCLFVSMTTACFDVQIHRNTQPQSSASCVIQIRRRRGLKYAKHCHFVTRKEPQHHHYPITTTPDKRNSIAQGITTIPLPHYLTKPPFNDQTEIPYHLMNINSKQITSLIVYLCLRCTYLLQGNKYNPDCDYLPKEYLCMSLHQQWHELSILYCSMCLLLGVIGTRWADH